MLTTIPFEIPASWAAQFYSGEIVRFGSILKDAGTGRIVGHLQESGLGHSLLSSVLSTGVSPFKTVESLLNSASGIYTAVQVSQIKNMVATLHAFQMATFGMTLAGVGVSVAGFIYMHKRLNILDSKINQLLTQVDNGFQKQRDADLRQQMSKLRSLAQRARLAPMLANSHQEYREIASGLADQASYLTAELNFVVTNNECIQSELFLELAQALILCNNTHIECRIRTNDMAYALNVADLVGNDYRRLFDDLTPVSFSGDVISGFELTRILRDTTDSATSKPFLIDTLQTLGISGPEYLESLESEMEEPLLVLRS